MGRRDSHSHIPDPQYSHTRLEVGKMPGFAQAEAEAEAGAATGIVSPANVIISTFPDTYYTYASYIYYILI